MEKYFEKVYHLNQQLKFKILFHCLFWIFISIFNWSAVFDKSSENSRIDLYFYCINLLSIIIAFYIIDYSFNSKKNFSGLLFGFVFAILMFQYSTYYSISILKEFGEENGMIDRMKSKIGELSFYEIFYDKNLFYLNYISTIYLFSLPFGLKLFYEVFANLYESKKLKEENLKLELNFLRAQINPHFLFNTLNNIYGMVADNDRAADSILKLADLMRYSLFESGHETVSLENEIQFINDFVDLERLRLNKNKSIDMEISGDPANYRIIPLVLICFAENAVKHGLNKTNDSSWVKMSIRIEKDTLYFVCVNFLPANKKVHSLNVSHGIGLENTIRRLNAKYANKYDLNIDQDNNQYQVNLNIRLSGGI